MAGWLPGPLAATAAAAADQLRRTDRAVLGLYCQLLSSLLVSIMALVAKLAGRLGVPAFELVLARSLVLVSVSAAMLARQQGGAARWPWRSPRRTLLLLRGLCGLGAVSSLYLAVQWLPLSDTAVLGFLAPVFVAGGAPLVLGEPTGRGVLLAMPLCVAGVLLVAQPTLLFGSGAQALSAVGVAFGVAQAVFSAGAKLCIRSLSATEPVESIILSMAGVSTAGAALACALVPGQWAWPRSGGAWGALAAVGALGCGVQWLATTALKLSRAAPVIAMSYLGVVWGLLADLLLFHDPPNLLALAGAALVCGSSFLIVGAERSAAAASGGGGGGGPPGRPPIAPKAKHSSRALGVDSPPRMEAAAVLELAESGRQAAGVRWGSAADEGGGGAPANGAGRDVEERPPSERTPLVGSSAPR